MLLSKVETKQIMIKKPIDANIRHWENSIKAADGITADANVTLQKDWSAKKLDRNVVQNAQSKSKFEIDRKRMLEESLAVFEKNRPEL